MDAANKAAAHPQDQLGMLNLDPGLRREKTRLLALILGWRGGIRFNLPEADWSASTLMPKLKEKKKRRLK